MTETLPHALPVLCVHGIWDDALVFQRMIARLEQAGIPKVHALDLKPNDGSESIEELSAQVQREAARLMQEAGSNRIDLIGFSMGALVSRYFLQRLGGAATVRRYISISGPHKGTVTAFARGMRGIQQMRPASPLLLDLEKDEKPWGGVEVHSFWTPMDLMIVPASSSRLEGAMERKFPVLLHPLMLSNRKVIDAVIEVLSAA